MTQMKSANGSEGCIIFVEGKAYFRVYHHLTPEISFTDYRIDHSDLFILITDEDAYFYEDRLVLDHSPATLGK